MNLNKRELPIPFEGNILYLLIMFIPFIISRFIIVKNFYHAALISEYIFYLLPVLLYIKFKNYNLKSTLKLNKLSAKQGIITLIITLCALFISSFLNTVMNVFLSLFGTVKIISQNIPNAKSISNLILTILICAVTPAICEEALFRGFIMSSYERIPPKKAIILVGILFGLFHINVNLQGLLGLSFMGMILAYLVFKTNSIFSSMLAHFFWNFLGVLFTNEQSESFVNLAASLNFLSIMIIPTIICGILCFYLFKWLPSSKENNNVQVLNKPNTKVNIIQFLPILFVIFLYIYYSYKCFGYLF